MEDRKIRTLSGILIDVGGHRLSVYGVLGDTLLVDTHSSNCTQGTGIDFGTSIGDDAHNYLLPSLLTPRLAPISFAQVSDVLHNAMH